MGDTNRETATIAATTIAATRNINDLPEHLLVHILSFLPTLDTIPTSLISQKWRSLWSISPSLNFSYSQFPPYNTPSTTRKFFAEFVDRTLILRPHSPLLKFRLEFIFSDHYTFHVNSWVLYAIRNGSLELDLDFFVDSSFHQTRRPCYNFPFYALRNGKVEDLKLVRCDLTLPVNMSSVHFVSLKSMCLDQVYLSDQMVADLINGCPNLECLEVENGYGMENFKVCSTKLKEMKLSYFIRNETEVNLEIDCPNLISLSIGFFEVGKFCIKNLSSLVTFHTIILHSVEFYGYWSKIVRLLDQLPHIRSLTVQNWWLKFSPKDVFPKEFLLYNLKNLELQTGYKKSDLLGMTALLDLSPNLETMILDYLDKIGNDESLSEEEINEPINLSIPNLKEVKLKSFTGVRNEVNFVELLKKQGVVLEKIVIIPVQVGDISEPPIVLRRRPPKFEVKVECSSQREVKVEE